MRKVSICLPPIEEVVHEEPPVEEATESLPPPDRSGEGAQSSVINASPADLALYGDWQSLSLLRKKKRVKKLKARGLPTPNEDGSIPLFVA